MPDTLADRIETRERSVNLLVIDHDLRHVTNVLRMNRSPGARTTVGRSGSAGLEWARQHQPDLIVLSMELYDINGFDLCRLLRADSRTAAIPIIMVTSLDDTDVRHRGMRVGANVHLMRPYTLAEFEDAVERALSWAHRLSVEGLRIEVELELESRTEYLLEVNDFLVELCQQTPLSRDQVMRLRQAFLEIGLNAIEWGNRSRVEAAVRVAFRAFGDRVEVEVIDQGAGFDLNNLPHAANRDDPLQHLDVREQLGLREGGFGLLIARGLVDELSYEEGGSHARLVMRLRSTPAAAQWLVP